jgi:hypothetical protein
MESFRGFVLKTSVAKHLRDFYALAVFQSDDIALLVAADGVDRLARRT